MGARISEIERRARAEGRSLRLYTLLRRRAAEFEVLSQSLPVSVYVLALRVRRE